MYENQYRPQAFRKDITDDSNSHLQVPASQAEEELNSSDVDDGLPPLEANLNGIKPADFPSDSESESESDSNADS
ncbi:hypothetical protein GIB67_041091 [Kingdonia uniflora]|uniref:Uncharacterized protein n=1 Tax=Kingdonia uniflora TaxID=39325 RepID=A0A7J7LK67_9MAGN|nr:hypothetical protein GIB67_041091 [Kingdonia uniflora]